MAQRIIDISVALETGIASDPPGMEPKIHYDTHKDTAQGVCNFFPGMTPDQLPGGEGWAFERCEIVTHNGTHVDAPYHYATTMNGGERAITIDEVPLDWFFRPAVKLDFRASPDGHVVGAAELESELARIGHTLQPFDIVLCNTAAGARYGQADYVSRGCGFGREATLYLTSRGVRVVGTDAWSWDAPFIHTAKRFAETKDPSIIWEGHKAGRDAAYCQIEKLGQLDQLPAKGFKVACFPVKVKAASGGWTRAVAIID
ncbi:MAG: cyclase family protein [Hyphomicrobiaceae bacterium]